MIEQLTNAVLEAGGLELVKLRGQKRGELLRIEDAPGILYQRQEERCHKQLL
jgi:hypothetical protein